MILPPDERLTAVAMPGDHPPAGGSPGGRSHRVAGAGGGAHALLVAALVALAAGALLVLAPNPRTDNVVWGFDWDREPIDTAEPFRFEVVIDTAADLIESNIALAADYRGRVSNLAFTLEGESGAGVVAVEARNPQGEVVVRDLVGPDHYFQYPPDPGPTPSWLRVTAAVQPASVAAPGGEISIVVDIENPAANLGPVTVTRLFAEPFGAEPATPPAGQSITGLPACAALVLPTTLARGQHLVCELRGRVEGLAGETAQVHTGVEVATDDPASGVWSPEPLRIEIMAAATSIPSPAYVPPSTVIRPDPVVTGIATTTPGRYVATVEAAAGSAGFRLSLQASRSRHSWPWNEPGPGFALGLAFLAAGANGLLVRRRPILRRVAAAALVAAGLAVPVLLAITKDHTWYWRPYSHLVWIAALALPLFGMFSLVFRPGSWRRWWGLAGWVIGIPTALVVLAAVISSYAYGDSWIGGSFPGSYNGDYMGMGLHILAVQVAAPLLALASALFALGRGRAP